MIKEANIYKVAADHLLSQEKISDDSGLACQDILVAALFCLNIAICR